MVRAVHLVDDNHWLPSPWRFSADCCGGILQPPGSREQRGLTVQGCAIVRGIDPKKIGKRLQTGASDTARGYAYSGSEAELFRSLLSSALQSAATFPGIICGEKAVTDGPST